MAIIIEYLADRPEFVLQVATWYFNEWGHKEPDNSVKKTCERLNARLNRDEAPIPIVAVVDGNVVGVAKLKIHEMDIYPNRDFWLGGVYVDLPSRGQAVGELVVRRIEEISKRLEIKELFLQTKKLTGGLYARLGWTSIEQVNYQGGHVLVMHKKF